jgi:hypothetical protein
MSITFEAFLREAIGKRGEVRLVPSQHTDDGPVSFYAHVNGQDSSTVDFEVRGNELRPVQNVTADASEKPLPLGDEAA